MNGLLISGSQADGRRITAHRQLLLMHKLRRSLATGKWIVAVSGLCLASTAFTQSTPPRLVECYDLLPDNVQYSFVLDTRIDTRSGQRSNISVGSTDASLPDSTAIPPGTNAFRECVRQVLGISAEDWATGQSESRPAQTEH